MQTREYTFSVTIGVKVRAHIQEGALHWKQGIRTFVIPLHSIEAFGVQEGPKTMWTHTSMLLVKCRPEAGIKPKYSLSFNPDHEEAKALIQALQSELPESADTTRLPWEEAAPRLGAKAKNPWKNIPNGRVLFGTLMLFVNIFQITLNRPDPEIHNQDFIKGFYSAHVLIFVLAFWLIWSGKKKAKRKKEQS